MRLVHSNHVGLSITPKTGAAALLDIDAATFKDHFDRKPFLIGHRLVDHPLFALPRILELARTLPERNVEYNAGELPVSLDPAQTPRNGLSVEETVRRIAECKSWMVLKYVENDPEYCELLHRCLAEVRAYSELLWPGMRQAQGFVFLTSPNSVTPYHMDPEHNFLLQIRGSKKIHIFNGRDRSLVTEEDLERFYGGSHRNMPFRDEFRARAWIFDLKPGFGLHFPVTAPHFVENGPEVSVSFSITFRTPDLERRSIVHNVNACLRGRGWHPTPVGRSPWRDAVKCQAYRLWRKTRKLLGRPAP
ncbi:MAG: cupin-like domain-containing protein [Planctomycetes bacterium]|nr:cupin-like domain-containing protein [Planctomycetota bacterium]